MNLADLEIGKEYVLFSKQFNAANHVMYLGRDEQCFPDFFKSTGGLVREIGYFQYSRRPDQCQFAIHGFQLDMGFSEITTEHKNGRIVS